MKNELIEFLSEFHMFNETEITELATLMMVKAVKKNSFVVEQGQLSNKCFFILKGCLRQYTVIDGVEKSTAFYTERESVNFFTSYTHKTTSASYLYTLEDSVMIVGTPETDAEIYKRFPILAAITRKIMEEDFGKTQDNFSKFITSSPEERYLDIIKERPELLQRVSQLHIASYLGITPESLSRIRKRVLVK